MGVTQQVSAPGCAIALTDGSSRVTFSAYGTKRVDRFDPITPDSYFAVGSLTKPVIAALVMRLVECHVLSLDGDVPGWPGVTVRMLLSHTSGIPSNTGNPALLKAVAEDRSVRWTCDRALTFVPRVSAFEPGSRWAYSNTNYLLLGQVIENATGLCPSAALDEFLLKPAGIEELVLQHEVPLPADRVVHSHVRDDRGWIDITGDNGFVPSLADATSAWTAGGIAATVPALVQFTKSLFTGLLRLDSTTQLTAFQHAKGRRGSALRYGLGVMCLGRAQRQLWGHTGGITGSRALAFYAPATGTAVAMAWNSDAPLDANVLRLVADVTLAPEGATRLRLAPFVPEHKVGQRLSSVRQSATIEGMNIDAGFVTEAHDCDRCDVVGQPEECLELRNPSGDAKNTRRETFVDCGEQQEHQHGAGIDVPVRDVPLYVRHARGLLVRLLITRPVNRFTRRHNHERWGIRHPRFGSNPCVVSACVASREVSDARAHCFVGYDEQPLPLAVSSARSAPDSCDYPLQSRLVNRLRRVVPHNSSTLQQFPKFHRNNALSAIQGFAVISSNERTNSGIA